MSSSEAVAGTVAKPSAVNLKFLSLLAASSFRNFKFKTALESVEVASGPYDSEVRTRT